MTSAVFLKQCWKYYLMLESDFSAQQRYITFEADNFSTYSLELSKQYLSICSEIDVICKQYCKHLDPAKSADTIDKYADIILQINPEITASKISLKEDAALVLMPWNDWKLKTIDSTTQTTINEYTSPGWWVLYNKVKHQRLDINSQQSETDLYYKSANLENVITALAGLFALEMQFYKSLVIHECAHSITIPPESSKFFSFDDWETHLINAGNGMIYTITGQR